MRSQSVWVVLSFLNRVVQRRHPQATVVEAPLPLTVPVPRGLDAYRIVESDEAWTSYCQCLTCQQYLPCSGLDFLKQVTSGSVPGVGHASAALVPAA